MGIEAVKVFPEPSSPVGSLSAGTTRGTLGEIVFSNSNGLSFGIDGQTVTGSVAAGVAAGSISAGTTRVALGEAVFSNSNGVSFGLNVSTVTGSIATSLTNIRVSAGTTSNLLSAITFSNVNGISFGLDASTLTGSHNALTSQSTQFLALTLGGNTAGTTTFHATNNASLFFHGGNNITLSGNGSSITISAGAAGGAVVSNAIQPVSSATGSGTNTSRFAADDHVHEGIYSAGVSNVGNTAGNTAIRPGRWVFAGSNAITLSQETAAASLQTLHIQGPVSATTISSVATANTIGTRGSRFALEDHQHGGVPIVSVVGNTSGTTTQGNLSLNLAGGPNITLSCSTVAGAMTVSISGGAGGGGGDATLSRFNMWDQTVTATSISSHAPASWWFNPFYLPAPLTCSNIWMLKSCNVGTGISSNSSGRQSYSYTHGVTLWKRQDWAANSTNMTTVTTASVGVSMSRSHTASSNSVTISWVTNTTGGTSSFTTTSNGNNWSNFFTGMRLLAIPLVTSFSAGEYFIAHRHSSTTATSGSNLTLMSFSNLMQAQLVNTFFASGGPFGVSVGQSSSAQPAGIGLGIASAVTITTTYAASVITATTQHVWFANFVNLART